MKVLAITAQPDRPEAHLFRALADSGVALHVINEAGSRWEEVYRESTRVTHLTFGSRFDLKSWRALRRIIHEVNPTIIHTMTARALTAALMVTLDMPQVKHVTYRGTCGHLSRFDPTAWLSYLHPRVSAIVCVSDAVRRSLASLGIAPNTLKQIYKGHELNWYARKPDRSQIRQQYGLPPDKTLIAFVGNMRPVKGADLLIEAFSNSPVLTDAALVLVGEVRDPTITKQLANSPARSRIHSLGFQAEAAAILSCCDIAVVPSRDREGLPKAAIEAMAQGLCVVTSDAGGLPELVEDQRSGIVFPAGDTTALQLALERVAQESTLRSSLGSAGKARIGTTFNVSSTVSATLDLYRELATCR